MNSSDMEIFAEAHVEVVIMENLSRRLFRYKKTRLTPHRCESSHLKITYVEFQGPSKGNSTYKGLYLNLTSLNNGFLSGMCLLT